MSHATHNGLLSTTAVVSAAYAVAFLVAPAATISLFGLQSDASAIWMARLLGASALGFAALAFFSRRIADIDARRAIDGGFLVMAAGTLAVTMWAQYLHVMNTLGWVHVAITGSLAVAYFYFLAGEDRLEMETPARPA